MGSTTSYEYINAKLHAIRGTMYEGDRLEELLRAQGLPELARMLFPEQGSFEVSAQELERRLTVEYFEDLHKVCRNLGEDTREFFTGFLRKADVENLKVVYRVWANRKPERAPTPDDVEPLLITTPVSLRVPIADLLGTETTSEFIAAIPDRALAATLLKIAPDGESAGAPSWVEIALDVAYYEQLMFRARALGADDRDIVDDLVGMDADVSLLLWVMRLTRTYGASADDTVTLLSHLPSKIGPARIRALCTAVTDEDRIRATPIRYRGHFSPASLDNLSEVEQRLYSIMHNVARRYFRRLTADIAGVVAYFFLKRTEFINLIRAVEAVRFGLPIDAAQALVLPSAEEA